MSEKASIDRPLSGIRVIGLNNIWRGPTARCYWPMQAPSNKNRAAWPGDPRRAMPPFAEKDGVKKAAGFMGYNRKKAWRLICKPRQVRTSFAIWRQPLTSLSKTCVLGR